MIAMNDVALDRLITASSIAVIGASDDPHRIGGRPVAYMRQRGFAGEILPVNPGRKTVQGLKAYESVEALPYAPDTAIVAVPEPLVAGVIDALGKRKVRSAVVFTSGFAEVGPDGLRSQQELLALARSHDMRLLGPNTLGLYNDRIGFYPTFSTSFESGWPLAGRIGIASQSGAFAAHIFTSARERRIGIPVCITTGNECDVTLGEAMQWLVQDPDTDVLAVYAEGLRDAVSFLAALQAAHAARKPVVLMKTGRSVVGSSAAQSHTSAIAGDDSVLNAVLSEFAVVRARSAEELLDIAHLATRRIYPVCNTLGVLSISGGAGVLISDICEDLKLPLPELPLPAQQQLQELIPFASVRNPVDCTAQVLNDLPVVGKFADAIAGQGGFKSILNFFTQAGGTASVAPELQRQLADVRNRYPDRLFVMSVLGSLECTDIYEASGITVFSDPTRAVVAIEAMGRFGDAFAREPSLQDLENRPVPLLPTGSINEAEAKLWLARAGIPCVPEAIAADIEAAVSAANRIGYPVVLKILSPNILHKSEIGGVLLEVRNSDAVRAGFALLMERAAAASPRARIDGVLVARQIENAVECIVGVHRDPLFGPVLMFGLGGIFVEVMQDVVLHRCPVDHQTARKMIGSIRGARLLEGARGKPPCDVDALAAMLVRLSSLAAAAGPGLLGIDLNPVLVLPKGQGCLVADALVETCHAPSDESGGS
jgi:acyl-CoA synthetase (NDP forming)